MPNAEKTDKQYIIICLWCHTGDIPDIKPSTIPKSYNKSTLQKLWDDLLNQRVVKAVSKLSI